MDAQLTTALQAILQVDFKTAEPVYLATVGGFLERAANEINTRVAAVSQREADVSEREQNVQLQEEQMAANLKALTSVERAMRTLTASVLPAPAKPSKKHNWW